MRYLLPLAIFMLIPQLAFGEQSCQRFWDFSQEVKPIPFKTKQQKIPSYVKSWRQLVAHSPRNIKVHFFYKANRRIKPRTTWGNFGWDKSLSTYRNKFHKAYAKLYSLGGEPRHLNDAAALTEDIDQHYRFAREHRCLNRRKVKFTSFMQSIPLRQPPLH